MCNAPSYFGSIWNFLKKWIDPKTGEKVVVVYAADVLSTLETVIDIENIPQSLGGKLDWEAGMPSVFDDGMCQQLEWVQEGNSTPALPRGPVKWIVDDEGVRTAIAVGTVDGKARRERIAVLRPGKTNGEKIQNGQH